MKAATAWMLALAIIGITLPGCGGFQKIDKDTAEYVLSLADQDTDINVFTQYLVGPEDVLEVRVWGDPALSKTVSVRPDGMITLPLIGDVRAAGKSSKQLGDEVEKLLRQYKSTPQVDVSIGQINSYRIYLLGEVNRPGMIQVRNFTTLLQAIALAGGPSRFSSNDILLLRRDRKTGTERVLHLDYRVLSSDKQHHRPYNVVVWPGDTIILK